MNRAVDDRFIDEATNAPLCHRCTGGFLFGHVAHPGSSPTQVLTRPRTPRCAIGAQGAFFWPLVAHPVGGDAMSTSTFARANRERQVATTGTTAGERRIQEAAEGHLRRSGYLALRDIGCTCREGVVTLRGCLPTYYLKQIAQHLVAEIEGVRGIINQIEVLVPSRRNDLRPFSPGVSIGRDRTGPGATPSPEE